MRCLLAAGLALVTVMATSNAHAQPRPGSPMCVPGTGLCASADGRGGIQVNGAGNASAAARVDAGAAAQGSAAASAQGTARGSAQGSAAGSAQGAGRGAAQTNAGGLGRPMPREVPRAMAARAEVPMAMDRPMVMEAHWVKDGATAQAMATGRPMAICPGRVTIRPVTPTAIRPVARVIPDDSA